MNFTKAEMLLLQLADSGKFEQGTRRTAWVRLICSIIFIVGLVAKIANNWTSLNIVFVMMTVGFFGIAFEFVRFKCRALGVIRKLQHESPLGSFSASSAPPR